MPQASVHQPRCWRRIVDRPGWLLLGLALAVWLIHPFVHAHGCHETTPSKGVVCALHANGGELFDPMVSPLAVICAPASGPLQPELDPVSIILQIDLAANRSPRAPPSA